MKYILCTALLLTIIFSFGQPHILNQRAQATLVDELLDDRLKNTLPKLMRREGIDMWIIISREYNEDPIIKTFLPATWMAARRTTILVMFDRGPDKELELLAVSRYDVGQRLKRAWDPDHQPNQWTQLGKIIDERNPKKIG
ncbi:MAG: hypothetical protein JNJ72_19595, partial [Anaerolineales bacterium]|nr:hypothetical protein [Anaerolineales bacterium]